MSTASATSPTDSGNNNGRLLDYHDALIYPSDLALLDSPSAWLNDACINFRMTRLQRTQDERRCGSGSGDQTRDKKRQKTRGGSMDGAETGGGRIDQLEDLFLDPSVVSFLMHQLNEDDDDYAAELSNLNASWNLPQPPTSGHERANLKKLDNDTKNGELKTPKSSQTHQRKRVFIPISDQFGATKSEFATPVGGNHWSLLLWEINALYYEAKDGYGALVGVGFHHFDSSKGTNSKAARAVAKKMHAVLCASMSSDDGVADVVEVEECRTPQQNNGHDCGMFALGNAEALSASDDYGFSREQHENLLEANFEERGARGEFARGLRKQIGDDIRELAAAASKDK